MSSGSGSSTVSIGKEHSRMADLDYELWHACAGPLTSLPPLESLVMYWPQGHVEQVMACTPDPAHIAEVREVSKHYNLPSHLLCRISRIEPQVDPRTDEVFAQMDLTPELETSVTEEMRSAPPSKRLTDVRSFYKVLTASDTSTHGGFSVQRRAARILPPLNFNADPPCQDLVAKDLHGQEWTFRHIYRGQPKRHLLTTGWSSFVSAKRLVAGDTVVFLCGKNDEMRVGVRRVSKKQSQSRSTCFSSANLHVGVLAAASHAVQNNLRFSVIFNPRTSPSEFVIPYHKVLKAQAMNFTAGRRFKMQFEVEDSSVKSHTGIVIEVSQLSPAEWPGSQWRSVYVHWDLLTKFDRPERVSPWEIERYEPIEPLLAPSIKRRPRPLVTDATPQESTHSMHYSYEPYKVARTEPNVEIIDLEDDEVETSRPSLLVNPTEDKPVRISGTIYWIPVPKPIQYVCIPCPFPLSPLASSAVTFAGPRPPAPGNTGVFRSVNFNSLRQTIASVRSLKRPSTARRKDFPAGVNFPFHDPAPKGQSSQIPANAAASSIAPAPTKVPITSLNNDAGANISPQRDSRLSFQSVWEKGEPSSAAEQPNVAARSKTTAMPEQQQCKLFGVNLAERVALAPLNLAASSCPGRDALDVRTRPSTDVQATTFVDLLPGNHCAAWTSSQDPVIPGSRKFQLVHPGELGGRPTHVLRVENYDELRRRVAVIMNLEGQVDDPTKDWQLVCKEQGHEILLVGEGPWAYENLVKYH